MKKGGMLFEAAFAMEYATASRVAPGRRAAIVAARVPRFGVVGLKCAQIVANRPDAPLSPDVRAALGSALARADGRGGVRASFGTVVRRPCDGAAVKRANSPGVHARLSAVAWVARAVAPEMASIVMDPLVSEAAFEDERDKNAALRSAWRGAPHIVIPRVRESSRTEVVMDFEGSELVKDLQRPVPARSVNALFRALVWKMLTTGVLHCDLHAGNVGVRRSGRAWEFVIYDFGSIRSIPPPSEGGLGAAVGMLESAALGDWECVVRIARARGMLVRGSAEQVRTLVSATSSYAMGLATLSDLQPEFARTGGEVAVEPGIGALFAAIASLDGTCKRMNPSFSIARAWEPASPLEMRI